MLEATLEATHDGILVLGLDHRVIRYNRLLAEMLRLPPEAIDAGNAEDLLRGIGNELEDPEAFERRSKELWNEPAATSTDVLRFKDGRVFERFVAPHRIGSTVVGRVVSLRDIGATLEQLEPADLIKYGLIPEFVGRLPVVGTLHELDKAALVQILTQPRNAITRQYMKLFEYENVKLRFTDDALEAIAEAALERKIGARGLRMIIEDLMLDLMYQVPNQKKLREVTITREVVMAKDKPIALIEKAG